MHIPTHSEAVLKLKRKWFRKFIDPDLAEVRPAVRVAFACRLIPYVHKQEAPGAEPSRGPIPKPQAQPPRPAADSSAYTLRSLILSPHGLHFCLNAYLVRSTLNLTLVA